MLFLSEHKESGRGSQILYVVCFVASICSSSHFLIFMRTARVTASSKTSLTILLLSLSLRRKEKEPIICQCHVEVHIKITCTKSQGQHEPYFSHVPSSTRLWSCQVQWPWSGVKITVRGHCVLDGSPSVDCPWGSRMGNFRLNLIATVCFTLPCGRSCIHFNKSHKTDKNELHTTM